MSSVVVALEGGTATVEYDPSVVSVDDLVGTVAGAPGMNGSPGQFDATAAD